MALSRIDKILANSGIGSRTDVKKYLKNKKIIVDGEIITKADFKIDPEINKIYFNNKLINFKQYVYLMLNKPSGIISATTDLKHKTVIDLLDEKYKHLNLFPVGRLDIDTVGLVILTNDGTFAHNTLSPKKHVTKEYFAKVSGKVTQNDINSFQKGILIDDDYLCKPAILKIINTCEAYSEVSIEISEGKFHQIKRMFKAIEKNVLFLKRTKFGKIRLDENLKEGEYRELNEDEMSEIKIYIKE